MDGNEDEGSQHQDEAEPESLKYEHEDPVSDPYWLKDEMLLPPVKHAGLDKRTLMKCSGYAEWYFTFHPHEVTQKRLPLPLKYPEKRFKGGPSHAVTDNDSIMSYVEPKVIQEFIIPWLRNMEKVYKSGQGPMPDKAEDIPLIGNPSTLEDKINLYNAMLHLAIPNFFQRELIEELCIDIYCNKLTEHHLRLLEFTVGRFNARTVSVLDPVLCCLTGSYVFRETEDREAVLQEINYADRHTDRVSKTNQRVYPDRVIVQPRLPVLAHNIQNWSRGGAEVGNNVSGTHSGYPLHIGTLTYYSRKKQKRGEVEVEHLQVADQYDLLKRTKYLPNPPGKPRNPGQ